MVWLRFYDDQKNNTCSVNMFDFFLNDVLFFVVGFGVHAS